MEAVNGRDTCLANGPYLSAPSSPRRGEGVWYYSAPTSPVRSAKILSEFSVSKKASVPFLWEESPGIPKKQKQTEKSFDDNDSDFEFSARFESGRGSSFEDASGTSLSTAEELFCNGKIRTRNNHHNDHRNNNTKLSSSEEDERTRLRPPPGGGTVSSPCSPRGGAKIWHAWIPFHHNHDSEDPSKDFDPFAAALKEARKAAIPPALEPESGGRGRDRLPSHRRVRSFSPLRVFHWEYQELETLNSEDNSAPKEQNASDRRRKRPKSRRKWSLKDLFRSSTDGSGRNDNDDDRLWKGVSEKHVKIFNVHTRRTPKENGKYAAHDFRKKYASFHGHGFGIFGCLGISSKSVAFMNNNLPILRNSE